MVFKPTISGCKTKVLAGTPQTVVAEADCAAPSLTPSGVWIGTAAPTRIEVEWTAHFESSTVWPRVNYVQNSPIRIGISHSTASVQVGNHPRHSAPIACAVDEYDDPSETKRCTAIITWTNIGVGALEHKQQFSVSATARVGGQKTGNSQVTHGNFRRTVITGETTSRQTLFSVDLEPPTHCLFNTTTADDCTCFPIYLDQDITTNPVVNGSLCGWSDDASGIDRYHVEVYYLQPSYSGPLGETGSAIYQEDIRPPYNSFRFTCRQSGVFSIQLTVFDRANNTARARKIFNHDGESKLTVNADVRPHITEATEASGRRWINNLPVPRAGSNYTLTLTWTGRYKSDARYRSTWIRSVSPWSPGGTSCTLTNNCIDDIYPDRFGLRSLDALHDKTGIVGYQVSYEVDSYGGIGLSDYDENVVLPASQQQYQLSIPPEDLDDGRTVVVALTVSDFAGNTDQVRLTVGLDRTRPNITQDRFAKMTIDEFTSSLYLTVVDKESGIKSINYSIYDITLKSTVYSKSHAPATLNMVGSANRTKRAVDKQCPPGGDSTCYCTPNGTCFPIIQQVDMDNCNFDRYTDHPLQIQYVVTNEAGLEQSGKLNLEHPLTDINCRPVSDGKWGGGAIAGVAIGICVPVILLLALIGFMIWRWIVHKDPLPKRARTIVDRTFHRSRFQENVVYQQPPAPKLDCAAAGGGVICDFQPKKNNNAYVEDEYYTAGASCSPSKVSAKDVQQDKTLADGRFAVLKSGTVAMNNRNVPVAIKMLQRGFSAEDRKLMTEKANFLSGIAENENIVKFVASCEWEDRGLMLLLELCDMSLKDWLAQNSTVTVDVLEDIMIFVLGVARGVEFLHSRKIVHRRLRVGNVLLKGQAGNYVAKLIGFGPTADDYNTDGDAAADEVAVPVRWLSPELLQSMKEKKPLKYNNKTDAWSFGITVWEMYSQGAKPYADHGSREVAGLLSRDYRMECPADCPPELFRSVVAPCWEKSPSKRPEFKKIRTNVEKFRRSPDRRQNDDYYTAGAAIAADQTGTYEEMYDEAR